jgi:hypothetical protein
MHPIVTPYTGRMIREKHGTIENWLSNWFLRRDGNQNPLILYDINQGRMAFRDKSVLCGLFLKIIGILGD